MPILQQNRLFQYNIKHHPLWNHNTIRNPNNIWQKKAMHKNFSKCWLLVASRVYPNVSGNKVEISTRNNVKWKPVSKFVSKNPSFVLLQNAKKNFRLRVSRSRTISFPSSMARIWQLHRQQSTTCLSSDKTTDYTTTLCCTLALSFELSVRKKEEARIEKGRLKARTR